MLSEYQPLTSCFWSSAENRRRLEAKLLQLASGTPDNLDSIFEPLKLEEPIELTRSKAKGEKPLDIVGLRPTILNT